MFGKVQTDPTGGRGRILHMPEPKPSRDQVLKEKSVSLRVSSSALCQTAQELRKTSKRLRNPDAFVAHGLQLIRVFGDFPDIQQTYLENLYRDEDFEN